MEAARSGPPDRRSRLRRYLVHPFLHAHATSLRRLFVPFRGGLARSTDLRTHDIVLGLLLSRLANMALLVATGLPILSLVLLWGGVDPELVLALFVGPGVTMVSLASVSILQSVNARRPRDAILRTYLIVVAFLVLSGLLVTVLFWAVALGWDGVIDHVLIQGQDQVTVRDVVEWFCDGNPLVLVHR